MVGMARVSHARAQRGLCQGPFTRDSKPRRRLCNRRERSARRRTCPKTFTPWWRGSNPLKRNSPHNSSSQNFAEDDNRANSLLAENQADAERIIAQTQRRKEDAKAAALQEREQAQEAVHEVRELVERTDKNVPAARLGKSRMNSKAEAGELNRTLAEVETAIEADNHITAKNKAKAVLEKSLQTSEPGAASCRKAGTVSRSRDCPAQCRFA